METLAEKLKSAGLPPPEVKHFEWKIGDGNCPKVVIRSEGSWAVEYHCVYGDSILVREAVGSKGHSLDDAIALAKRWVTECQWGIKPSLP